MDATKYLTLADKIKTILIRDYNVAFRAKLSVDRHIVKKNGRPIFKSGNKPFIGKSPDLRKAEEYYISQFKIIAQKAGLATILDPVWIMCLFHFAKEDFYTKKGIQSKTLPDLSNLIELPQDCLQKAGVIGNDTQVFSLDLSRRLPAERTELEIFVMVTEQAEFDVVLNMAKKQVEN